jgi:hypothetical protein
MQRPKDYIIYDVVNKKDIHIKVGSIVETCKQLNFDATSLPKLNPKTHISHRYIFPEAKERIFTLVDIETEKEYDCITNGTIFQHFNIPYSENEAKYIYELRKGRQGKASVCGKLFYLKGGRKSKAVATVKVVPSLIKKELENYKLKKIIKARIQARISAALSVHKICKNVKTEELLGCKISSFKEYIESKFTNFMGWRNRHLWHIDHIIPCNSFDLTDFEQQKKCFNYTNLQPIWKTTKVACKMGETDYQGNIDKKDKGPQYDYFLASKICKEFPDEVTNSEAKELASNLFGFGLRKILPEHLHLYDK